MTAAGTTDKATVQTLSPQALKGLLDSGKAVELIDVRTPVEYRGAHLAAARNLPLDKLDVEAIKAERAGSMDQPLYVVCQSGARSRKACEGLLAAGIVAVCIEGGIPACEIAGIPVTRGKQGMSLERQVRIGAGSLVASGVLLGVLVNPWFLAIPGFVGCGLIFAGVTDWCGMGLLLAKMPWNR